MNYDELVNREAVIQDFLQGKRTLDSIPGSGYPFVTIGRETGAGGHWLAYVLLTEFLKEPDQELFGGWRVFDKELCELVARDPRLISLRDRMLHERYRSEASEFVESLFTGYSPHYLAYKTTFKVVRALASMGKVIIVGRAGCCVTRDQAAGIHLRLVASQSQRIIWLMRRFKISKEDARKTIIEQDADKRKVADLFFSKNIDDPLLYDVVWNTGTVNLDEIARAIIQMIKTRAKAR